MKILLRWVFLVTSFSAGAQNMPTFRQFYFNPYLFNPSYAGIEGYSELFVYHRQQWINFNNAPSASGFNLQYAGKNRTGWGFTFTTQEVVALRNTSGTLTFAYRVPFSYRHYLSFGISGGIGSNNLKLDDKDYSNDPAVLSAADNSIYADGNFGVLYTLGKLRLGFTLPRLFGQKYYSVQPLGDVKYSQLRNQLYSASYRFDFASGTFTLEPYALYRMNRDLQNFWEAAAVLYYKKRIWLGGSYNSTQGTGFFLGMDFQDKVRFGYSYELPPPNPDFISTSSHEIHLQVRLGRKKIFRWAAIPEIAKPEIAQVEIAADEPVEDQVPVTQPPVPAELKREEIQQPIPSNESPSLPVRPAFEQVVETQRSPLPTPEPGVAQTSLRKGILASGYYVIVGSFVSIQYANQSRERFVNAGFDARVGQSDANKRYYVYIFASTDIETAREARDHHRKQYVTRNSWVLSIE